MQKNATDARTALLDALRAASDFETAAIACLARLMDLSSAAVEASDLPGGRVLRGLLHLRPDEEYAGLYALERGAHALTPPADNLTLLPSATVWRSLGEHRVPVAVDVGAQTLRPRGATSPTGTVTVVPAGGLSRTSHQRLVAREVTHLYALPLYAPGARLAGMATVEASCPAAMGREFPWAACTDALEWAAALAGPYLAALPRRAAPGLDGDDLLPVIGPTMAPLVQVLRAFAAEEETLLIRGETGTGKSRIARWCHARSSRERGPFEVLDLLSVPEEMQMGELFGWRKGAFTGAVNDHAGFVTRADGGTLFIDEIDKLSLAAQAGLLFLLEERRYRVLGDARGARDADVRFIIGTNVDLGTAVHEGRFREDLYYRIHVLPMALPPLRERPDEIGPWAAFMLRRRHAEKGAAGEVRLAADAQALLHTRSWPGNLRELDNVMRRAYTLASIGAGAGDRVVTAPHLRAALGFGAERGATRPIDQLRSAAAALVGQLAATEPTPDLGAVELPGALHGLLLAAAVHVAGGRDAAFELIGRSELIANRNHHRVLKRDAGRAIELCEALRETPPPELLALLESFGR